MSLLDNDNRIYKFKIDGKIEMENGKCLGKIHLEKRKTEADLWDENQLILTLKQKRQFSNIFNFDMKQKKVEVILASGQTIASIERNPEGEGTTINHVILKNTINEEILSSFVPFKGIKEKIENKDKKIAEFEKPSRENNDCLLRIFDLGFDRRLILALCVFMFKEKSGDPNSDHSRHG
jgi:hypothetical protein